MKHIGRIFSAMFLAFSLLSIVGCASTPTQEGTGQYIDDSVITGKVKAAILADPDLKVFQIKVTTTRGTVQLSGVVDSRAQMDKAVQVARGIRGVVAVKNDMRVK